MTRFPAALLVFARILLLWAAFHGAGTLLEKPVRRLMKAWAYPPAVLGLISCLLLTFPLSLAGILTRPVAACIITVLGLYGAWAAIRSIPYRRLPGLVFRPWNLAAILILAFFGLSIFFRAAKPQDNPDPLITYAVQPDRWLDAGRIYFLEETGFSAMPLLGETLAIWPASLSLPDISGMPGIDRDDFERQIDQLSLTQVFQLSLLIAAVLIASRKLDGSGRGVFLCLSAVLASSMLTGWGSLAKVDMTLAFFATMALLPSISRYQGRGEAHGLWPFLMFSLALSTKLTAWILLPFFLVLELGSERRSVKRLLPGFALMLTLPAAYMIRTMVHTGSLLYTGPMNFPEAAGQWAWTSVPGLDSLSHRTDPGFLADLKALALAWDYPLILLACGFVASMGRSGRRGRIVTASVFLFFAIVSLAVFVPAAWGAKYTLFVLPVIAALGASWWPSGRNGLLLAAGFVVAVAMGTETVQRARFISGFIRSGRMLMYDSDTYLSPRNLHLWANDSLPGDAVLLSLFSDERYHSDHEVICARTQPYARGLFEEGPLSDEIGILRTLGVTHVYFVQGDPLEINQASLYFWSPSVHPDDLTGSLAILGDIGVGGLLEPIHLQDGTYMICRVNYP